MHNPQTVDLLVSLAYVSALENSMEEPLPIGMGLRVPIPSASDYIAPTPSYNAFGQSTQPAPVEIEKELLAGPDGMVDFDDLTLQQVRHRPILYYTQNLTDS